MTVENLNRSPHSCVSGALFKGAFFGSTVSRNMPIASLDSHFEKTASELRSLRWIFSINYGEDSVSFKLAEMGIGKCSPTVFYVSQNEEIQKQLLAKLKKILDFMILEKIAATAITSHRTLEIKGISKKHMPALKRFFTLINFDHGLPEIESFAALGNQPFSHLPENRDFSPSRKVLFK